MRHQVRSRKLGRNSAHRKAMFRNMLTSLFEHERIDTTDAKAKELRRLAERIVTLGKRGDLHARRRALRTLRSSEVATKVFGDLAERYRSRQGGYTRIIKLGLRAGDAAPLSRIELVDAPAPGAARADEPKAKPAKQSAAAKPAAEKAPGKPAKAAKKASAPKPAKPAKPPKAAKASKAAAPARKKATAKKKSSS